MRTIDDISLSTTVFGDETPSMDFEKMLHMIKASGFSYIEISRHHHNIAKRESLIHGANLKVWSVHGVLSMNAASLNESDRIRMIESEKRRMDDTACFAPCPYVIHYVNRHKNPKHEIAFRKSVEELLGHACNLQFLLAVETAPYKPEIDERYPDSEEIARFVRSFGPDLSMTVDINHSNLHENLKEVCQNCDQLITNVHVSNNHGYREEHLPPEEGTIDLQTAFRDLRVNGYSGPCNLEIHVGETPTQDNLSHIHAYVDRLLFHP